MKAILAGGSGFLGQSFARLLADRGDEIVIFSRRCETERNGLRFVNWDGKNPGFWMREVDGADYLFNFTGRSVNCLYNETNKREILDSRVDSVRVLHQAIGECRNPPRLFCQAGSLAIYGDTATDCDEGSPHGDGFSAEVCKKWEEEFFSQTHAGVRACFFRIGFALGTNEGALGSLMKLTRYYLGGTVGKGNQYISWIHIDDLNAMFLFALENSSLEGVYNATGPAPVTNRSFMSALRRTMGKPWSPPIPALLVKIGARVIIKTDASLALTGRKCYPRRIMAGGFRFRYNDVASALTNLVSSAS
ncbi:MAG: TIGR01777 family oxidoreductase [Blastocatellia bacterium]